MPRSIGVCEVQLAGQDPIPALCRLAQVDGFHEPLERLHGLLGDLRHPQRRGLLPAAQRCVGCTAQEAAAVTDAWAGRPPTRVSIAEAILDLGPGDVRYGSEPIRFLVVRARPEISGSYDGAYCPGGTSRIDADAPVRALPILVRCAAIPEALSDDTAS